MSVLANANINSTHIVSLQLAQDLFGFLFSLSLLLLNVNDGTGGAAGCVPRVLVYTWQSHEHETRSTTDLYAGCQNLDSIKNTVNI